MAKSNIQTASEQQRAIYSSLRMTLLAQLLNVHCVTVRDFAAIFGVSKSHAADIVAHRKLPDLELAFRLARYFECTVDELFGWRIEDTGERRPLVVVWGFGKDKQLVRLKPELKGDSALGIVASIAENMRRYQEEKARARNAENVVRDRPGN
jgi:DNA-binding XRE family transcriptional regulator